MRDVQNGDMRKDFEMFWEETALSFSIENVDEVRCTYEQFDDDDS